MIEVRNISKAYGSLWALKEVSFQLEKGQILALVGPNGAGKTTLIRMLTTYLQPSSGEVVVASHSSLTSPLALRRSLGYLPERAPAYGELTVEEFLHFRSKLKVPQWKRKERRQHIQEILEPLGLSHQRKRPIRHLSRGYRQRVSLADALLGKPPVLILDEPTTAMDPLQKREILDFVRHLAPTHTILFSSHILAEVEHVAHQVLILHQGQKLIQGEVEQLLKEVALPTSVEVEVAIEPRQWQTLRQNFLAYIRQEEQQEGTWRKILFECPSWPEARELSQQLAERLQGHPLRQLSVHRPSLEDIFLALVKERQEQAHG